ncbi:tyrosine-type recombinase/integrase [Pollutimonas sp. H1-120]|uniref:site-specific integrase n=1 Tax=Pollutimonas sp. H1-120 TaxID=3148824 RepID=UPI003B52F5B1
MYASARWAMYSLKVIGGVTGSPTHPSTLLGYTKIIEGILIPKWGDVALNDLSRSMLREWIGQMGLTAKTIRNVLSPLRSVLDDAVNDELLKYNPLDRVALSKIIRQTAKKSEYDVDPFDIDEIGALLRHARPDERLFIEFWFQTGLRPGEIIALPWPNIDWVHGRIRIDTNIVTGIVDGKQTQIEKGPKTAAGIRDIEMSSVARAALTTQKAASFMAGHRVWLNPRTGGPWAMDSQVRKTLWEPLCRRAGVRYRNPYQIRHTYASTWLTNGANPFWLAVQMGHEDAEMVFKIYGKWIDVNYQKSRAAASPCESRVKSV